MKRVFIIAEAGVNHNGSIRLAKKMIDVASRSGADAVKFQTFRADDLVARTAPKAPYQKRTTGRGSQYEMLKRLELDPKAHKELLTCCRRKNIFFMSTPFDLKSIDLLAGLGLDIFKIPSGEITNLPYLRKVGNLRKKVIMSSGMAYMREIGKALDVLMSSGTAKRDITVLHCTSDYPARPEEVNLSAMRAIKERFNINVGYSDHTPGIEVAIAAAALGASVIEKHFTIDKKMSGPDHKASLEPAELARMVMAIRNVEKAIGDGVKKPLLSEFENRKVARKSILASRDIRKGEVFSEENITVKRPGTGMSPMRWGDLIGKAAKKHFLKDEMIKI